MNDFEFMMVWLEGNKYMVGFPLGRAIQSLQNSWQFEHDLRIRLEERLKAAEGKSTAFERAVSDNEPDYPEGE